MFLRVDNQLPRLGYQVAGEAQGISLSRAYLNLKAALVRHTPVH